MTSRENEADSPRDQAAEWLMRVQASPDDAALRERLGRWLDESDVHRKAYDSVARMWRVAGDLPRPSAAHGHAIAPAAGTLPHRPVAAVGRRRSPGMRRIAGVAAAALAACLIMVFLPSIVLRLEADHLTGTAELRDVRLADGSIVALDAGSAITVGNDSAHREVVLLAGQAFLEVVPAVDRPFVVRAGAVTVTVTGTAFAVRTSSEAVSVAVKSGTVEVAVDRSRPVVRLTQGQGLRVNRSDGRVALQEVAPRDVASWRDRRLVVDGATVGDVIEELRRHYAGAIVLRDRELAARRVTGVFDLRRPVEALEAMIRAQHGSVTQITPYLLMVWGR